MNKFILGGILAAISLMAIYGASASNRFTSWVDGSRPSSTQTNTAQGGEQNQPLVALNSTEANGDAIIDVSGMTPLEKAGTLPQRQTIGATSNFGGTPSTPNTDDTDGEIIDATNPPNNDSSTDTADNNQNNQNQNQTPDPDPIRALW